MKLKSPLIIGMTTVFILVCSNNFAETIYLKDGRVINEKIVERDPYYVMTMTGKVPRKYFTDQIEYIEEDDGPASNGLSVDYTGSDELTKDKARLIRQFVMASGVRNNMNQNIEQVIDQAPLEKREKLREMFKVDEVIERLIPVYNKYYSQEDLEKIIEFYESPAGLKVLDATPKIMHEAVGVSVQYIQEKAAP